MSKITLPPSRRWKTDVEIVELEECPECKEPKVILVGNTKICLKCTWREPKK